MKWPTKTRY